MFEWGDRLPEIPAPRVVLRGLTEFDLPELFAVFSDPQVMRYWDGVPMTSLGNAAAFLSQIHDGFRRRELFQWGISDRATDRIIGTCTLLHLNAVHRRGEIGFALAQAYWGQGLAKEAVAALIGFAFETLALHRLEADADPRNDRSVRLLERLNFRREGHLRERYHVGDERQDAIVFGLLRSDWRPS